MRGGDRNAGRSTPLRYAPDDRHTGLGSAAMDCKGSGVKAQCH
jgi:hypothetical protein